MKPRLPGLTAAIAVLFATNGSPAHTQAMPLGSEAPSVEVHKRAASKLAGQDLDFVYQDRCAPRVTPAQRRAMGLPDDPVGRPPRPTRVFDDVFYVGTDDVAAWAIRTKAGLLLLDSLNSQAEAQMLIEGGLQTLGLDPSRIKYVIVMHGHGDHFGGSRYLQTRGARVVMSSADWDFVAALRSQPATPRGWLASMPSRQIEVTRDETFRLGNFSMRLLLTPGHTPGTLSAIFPVTFEGHRHVAAFWGGTGYPTEKDKLTQYIRSLARFSAEARSAGADVFMSNHSHTDGAVQKMSEIDRQGGRNPMIGGKAYVSRILGLLNECAQAQLAR